MLGKAARYYRRDALECSFFVYSQKLTVSAHFAKVQPAPKPSRSKLLHIRITASPNARVSWSVTTLEAGSVGGILATP